MSSLCPRRLNNEWESWICEQPRQEGSLYCRKHSFSAITEEELQQAQIAPLRVHVRSLKGKIRKNFAVISVSLGERTAQLKQQDANGKWGPVQVFSIDQILKTRHHDRDWDTFQRYSS